MPFWTDGKACVTKRSSTSWPHDQSRVIHRGIYLPPSIHFFEALQNVCFLPQVHATVVESNVRLYESKFSSGIFGPFVPGARNLPSEVGVGFQFIHDPVCVGP